MKTITLQLTNKELAMLKAAVECQTDILDDTVTEELFVPCNQDSVTFTKTEMSELRKQVEERIDNLQAAHSLYSKVHWY